MLSKIHHIQGVGRFKDFKPYPPLEFARLNLIYARNGKGKSTLADLLRSMRSGQAERLRGRKTIGADIQNVVLELDNSITLSYHGNEWETHFDDVVIFDEVFINENIYQGFEVDKKQKRNLAPIIIGDSAVSLEKRVQELKRSTENRKSIVNSISMELQNQMYRYKNETHGGLSVEEFVDLEATDDFETEQKGQRIVVSQLEQASRTIRESSFSTLALPEFPRSKLDKLLHTDLKGIEETAIENVSRHLTGMPRGLSENWILQGRSVWVDSTETCPFCGQQLDGVELIKQYQAYFNRAYRDHVSELESFASVGFDFDEEMTRLISTFLLNEKVASFWSEQIDGLEIPELDLDTLRLTFRDLRDESESLLKAQTDSPLAPLGFSERFLKKYQAWKLTESRVIEYNRVLDSYNDYISNLKLTLSKGDLVVEIRRLSLLENMSIRCLPVVDEKCKEYISESKMIQSEDREKSTLQARIKETERKTFDTYNIVLNRYLKSFGADFTVTQLRQGRDNVNMRAEYSICLLRESTPASSAPTDLSSRSFGNLLSEGDRRTLALAFFLSRLTALRDLSQKLVVFDDPVTSLDDHRQTKTVEKILSLSQEAGQVIVLSHRSEFLQKIYDRRAKFRKLRSATRLFEIVHEVGKRSRSQVNPEWDVTAANRTSFDIDLRDVLEFVDGITSPNLIDIARKIRPLLENHYRSRYPSAFPSNSKQFGKFFEKMENSPCGSRLNLLYIRVYDDLKEVIEYANRYHHEDAEIPDEEDLLNCCRTTLTLLGAAESTVSIDDA